VISKHDADQLGGHVRWHSREYASDIRTVPVFLHPSAVFSPQATPPDGTRVITPGCLSRLKFAIRQLSVALASGRGSWHDEGSVADYLVRQGLTGGSILMTYSEFARSAAE
jgi:hypothetical protein